MRSDMSPSRDGMSSLEALGTVGLAGIGTFVVAVVAMHLIRPDLDPMDRTISEYALGGSGWLMTVAWFAGGAGVLALALGLHRSLAPGDGVRLSVWLMVITALVGFVASGVFRTDVPDAEGVTGATVAGQLHDGAGLVGFVALLVAAFVLRGVFARNPGWQDLSLPTRWFTRAMVAMFVARVSMVIVRLPGSAGLVQRILWLFMLAWLVLIGWRLRQLGHSPARTHEPRPVTGR